MNLLLEGLSGNLDRQDETSRRVAKALDLGDNERALSILDAALRRRARETAHLAYLRDATGIVALALGQLVRAEQAFAGAVAFAPDECSYRGHWGLTLALLHRSEEAERVGGEHVAEARRCMDTGPGIVRSLFLYVRSMLAIERRDESTAVSLVHGFETEIDELIHASPDQRVQRMAGALSCTMSQVVDSVWDESSAAAQEFRSSRHCRELVIRLDSAGSWRRRLAELDRAGGADLPSQESRVLPSDATSVEDAITALSRRIATVSSDSSPGQRNTARRERDVLLAQMYAARGTRQAWGAHRPNEAQSDYLRAYRLLEERSLTPAHPDGLVLFAPLISQTLALEIMFPELGSFRRIRQQFAVSIRRVAATRTFDPTPFACRALIAVTRAAESWLRDDVSASDKTRLRASAGTCIETGVSRGSLQSADLGWRIALADAERLRRSGDLMAAQEKLGDAIALLDNLKGFPMHADRSGELSKVLEERVALRSDMKEFAKARADLTRLVSLKRELGLLGELGASLYNLASYIVRHGGELKEASGIATEAFEAMQEDVDKNQVANRSVTCATVLRTLNVGQFAVSMSLAVKRPRHALGLLPQIERIAEREKMKCAPVNFGSGAPDGTHVQRVLVGAAGVDAGWVRAVLAETADGEAMQVLDTERLDKNASDLHKIGDDEFARRAFPLTSMLHGQVLAARAATRSAEHR